MKRRTKLLCLVLAILMLVSMVGCDAFKTVKKVKVKVENTAVATGTDAPEGDATNAPEGDSTDAPEADITSAPYETDEATEDATVTSAPENTSKSETSAPAATQSNTTAKVTAKATANATAKVTAKATAKATASNSSGTVITYDTDCLISRDYVRVNSSIDMVEPGHGEDDFYVELGDYSGKKLGLWGWYGTTLGTVTTFGYAIDDGAINYSSSYKIAVSADVTNACKNHFGSSTFYTGYFDINPIIPDAKSHKYEIFAKVGNENVHIWTVYGLAVGAETYVNPNGPTPKPSATTAPSSGTTFTDSYVDDGTKGYQQSNGYFTISYKTNSYVTIGSSIKLNASYTKTAGGSLSCTFASKSTDIATCDTSGNVKGVKMGLATIRCSVSNGDYIDFYVTVIPSNLTSTLKIALDANNANVTKVNSLNIGGKYTRNIYGSISKILYNDELSVNNTYNSKADTNTANSSLDKGYATGGRSMQFITVHYTGNMSKGATAAANADYFAGCSGLGIHYTTGNDGAYKVISYEKYTANQIGDRIISGIVWKSTGVKAPTTGDQTPTISISSDGYFTINGTKSTYHVPSRAFSAKRFFSNSGWTGDDITITGPTFVYSGSTLPCITELGIPWKVQNGEYKLLDTYWDSRQKSGGRICAYGGDYASIGIESCVNEDSELWYTWNRTAQLVASLMKTNKLDITRVVGHNTWTSKNCPQPFLENNCQLWYVFKDMCQAEYNKLASGGKFSMKIIKGSEVVSQKTTTRSLTSTNGTYTVSQGAGVTVPDSKAHVVLYEVTVVLNGKTEKIKLASAVNRA